MTNPSPFVLSLSKHRSSAASRSEKKNGTSTGSVRTGWGCISIMALAACSPEPTASNVSLATDLESAAIERGLVRDPGDTAVAGLYARDTDRLCVVPDGARYRAGAYVDYGDGIACNGSGPAEQSGDRLRIELGDGCTIDAGFDGERVTFPARIADACKALCSGRASFAALNVTRLSESLAEAAAMRDGRGRLPCRTN